MKVALYLASSLTHVPILAKLRQKQFLNNLTTADDYCRHHHNHRQNLQKKSKISKLQQKNENDVSRFFKAIKIFFGMSNLNGYLTMGSTFSMDFLFRT